MNNKKTIAFISVIILAIFISISPISTNALSVSTDVQVQANTSLKLSDFITKSDVAINDRITVLNNLNTRVQAMKNVSASLKENISNEIRSNIDGLTSLKAKIDSDTDITVARSDAKAITGSYRIYALIIPQGYITASADRINTIVSMMSTVSAKLQTRITAAQTAGKDVASLQAMLSDLNAKISDAQVQAGTDQNGIASLKPDGGNLAQFSANTAALKAARADIKIATKDLQSARMDIKNIIQGLKALNIKTSASVSASASTTAE